MIKHDVVFIAFALVNWVPLKTHFTTIFAKPQGNYIAAEVVRSIYPGTVGAAYAKGLFYTPRPSYKAIQTILKSGQDKPPTDESETPSDTSEYGFTRGSGYYGGRGRG